MTRKPKYLGGGVLENLHRWVTENHLGWQLPDQPTGDDEIEHQPFQDLRSVEDYRKDLGSNISLGSPIEAGDYRRRRRED